VSFGDSLPPEPVLVISGLRVSFPVRGGRLDAVKGIGLRLSPGRCHAIVGESGSGKSATARALVGLAGGGAVVRADRMELAGRDLRRLSERQWRSVRGGLIGFVPQEALGSLDPMRTVGAEIGEALGNHGTRQREVRAQRAVELLREVSVPEPGIRAGQYPHQLSGGLRQRALIATAIAAAPGLIIADEPTTSLDVTVQAEILELLATRKAAGTAVLLISHDLSVVARLADSVSVMRHGAFVEQGPTAEVLASPAHPYTRQLLAAVPLAHPRGARLSGTPRPAAPDDGPGRARQPEGTVVLEAEGLYKSFRDRRHQPREAVRDVSLAVLAGQSLGIVGESGSGKSTTARMLLGLTEPDAGQVRLLGEAWSGQPEAARRSRRRRIGFIQQDPLSSFDPRYRVDWIIAEALGGWPGRTARRSGARVEQLLKMVGLDPRLRERRPAQLSGGQRQRVAIARALAPGPDVIVCDEPVSALDVSSQAQIVDLLADIRRELSIALVFISHDLGVVYHVSDQVLVMRDGAVVEQGSTEDIFTAPRHAYTRSLLAAVPRLTERRELST
jgi:ABC-type glutathione transport system ATPase component